MSHCKQSSIKLQKITRTCFHQTTKSLEIDCFGDPWCPSRNEHQIARRYPDQQLFHGGSRCRHYIVISSSIIRTSHSSCARHETIRSLQRLSSNNIIQAAVCVSFMVGIHQPITTRSSRGISSEGSQSRFQSRRITTFFYELWGCWWCLPTSSHLKRASSSATSPSSEVVSSIQHASSRSRVSASCKT